MMNGNTTKKKRQELITKYGEFCRCCGKLPNEGTLVLNRIDNNNKNTRLENLQLLCRSCVNLRNETDEHDDLCVNTQTKEETCLSINREKEPKFREFVHKTITPGHAVALRAIIYSGAEEIDASPVTVRRYLDKMASRSGELIVWEHDGIPMVKFKEKND